MSISEFSNCLLCPRRCGVNRQDGQVGFCGVSDTVLVARAAPHLWEEPCLSGQKGAGAVFFAGCNLGCVFCQNAAISRAGTGKPVSVRQLAAIFLRLQRQQVHTLDLVTATPYLPAVRQALSIARQKGLTIPVVYNCGGYEQADQIQQLNGAVDVFLPDIKFYDPALARRCCGVSDYFEQAAKALAQMVKQTAPFTLSDKGILQSGVLVRHLVLPGHTDDSKRVLAYLYTLYGNRIGYSIMSQYTPPPSDAGNAARLPHELRRRLTAEEYQQVVDFAANLGIENGYVQQMDSADSGFIPDFDGTGV